MVEKLDELVGYDVLVQAGMSFNDSAIGFDFRLAGHLIEDPDISNQYMLQMGGSYLTFKPEVVETITFPKGGKQSKPLITLRAGPHLVA